MAHSVLVAGATGMLGSKIAHALLEKNVEVMVLTRSLHPYYPKSAQHLAQLQSRGSQVVEGDLSKRESLLKATEGAHALRQYRVNLITSCKLNITFGERL